MGETLPYAGAHHLDGDLPAAIGGIHLCRMHLRNRGCGNRIVESRIKLFDRATERAFDTRLCRRNREEGHPVLKLREVVGEFDADDVRPGRQKLTDLHIGRSEPLDCLGQPIAAFLGFARLRANRPTKDLARLTEGGKPSEGSAETTPSRTRIQPTRTSRRYAPKALI
ncbi:hypothetical protein AJ87_03980 [Rhizobium yanglingense]|nr:hypothetical protein AJ87_03980 [Rhizobium yanglingense]